MKGIGAKSRERLAKVLRETSGAIKVADAAHALGVSNSQASKLLSAWSERGWVKRVKRGIYIPVPLDAFTENVSPEDPWILADALFAPCYIGGWSAAEYWDFTEQIFSSLFVFTTKQIRQRDMDVEGTIFKLKTVNESQFFGLKSIWRGSKKIQISDPSKTLIDMLNEPAIGGGIRHTADIFNSYLDSEHRDLTKLLDYASSCRNKTVFKRLGYLLERFAPENEAEIAVCKKALSKGNSKLDPSLPSDFLVTRWKLWIPSSWKEGVAND